MFHPAALTTGAALALTESAVCCTFNVRVVEAELPALSVAVPLKCSLAPAVVTLIDAGQFAVPESTTGIAPRATPLGTGATMLVLLQLVGVAGITPKVIVLVPCVVPKPIPAIVTDVPIGPDAGVRLVIAGATAAGLTSTRVRL